MFAGYFYFYLAAFGTHNKFLEYTHWGLEGWFLVKILLTFNTVWFDAQKEIYYSNHYHIFNKYVNSWIFIKEIIPLIPLELI
jgi:hypothetical protein